MRPTMLRPLGEALPEMPARFPDLPPETWEQLVRVPYPLLCVQVFGATVFGVDHDAVVGAVNRVIDAAASNPRALWPRGWIFDRRLRTKLLRLDRRAQRRDRRGRS